MSTGSPKPVLSLLDATAIVVGIVVGAGIFRLPSAVMGAAGDPDIVLLLWLAGGAISLLGALCYGELATAFPSAGGEYHFLVRAYGRDVGFLFSWARLTVIQSGSIALFAYVLGDYASELLRLGPYSSAVYAVLAVLALTALNLAGIRQTKTLQNVLFVVTLGGLAAIVLAGLTLPFAPAPAAPAPLTPAGIGSAMLLILLTYGGWNEAAYVSAEVTNPGRNMVRSMVLGLVIVTGFYVAVNFSYIAALGPAAVATSSAVAADLMGAVMGKAGAVAMTLLVLAVVLDNTNITMFTGARGTYALGRDFPMFGFLHHWDEARGVPTRALLLQSGVALAIVLLGVVTRQGVQAVVDYLQPVFWTFFLLTGVSLFVLRRREPGVPRPFRVPLYPVTPALFCLVGAYMLYSSLAYTQSGALAGVVVLALGLPLLFFARRNISREKST
jgi:amino acid transporter